LFNLQGTLRFAVLHAAVADSLINIAHILQKVKNFFHFPEKIFEPRCAFAPGSQVLSYYIPSTLVCQPVFSVLCIFLSSFPPLVVLFDHKAQFTARLYKSHLPIPLAGAPESWYHDLTMTILEGIMTAPLYDSLQRFADSDPLRLHMPGHKGRMDGLFRDASSIDFTELPPTGNLYTGEGPIADAEALFARTGGARDALFFTCGAVDRPVGTASVDRFGISRIDNSVRLDLGDVVSDDSKRHSIRPLPWNLSR
jgi:hypothetical protein